MKYYIALAINKNDKSDILGLCENSFSMSWERNKVNLFAYTHTEQYGNIPLRKYFKEQLQKSSNGNDIHCGFNHFIKNVKGRYRAVRKMLADLKCNYYHDFGRTDAEYSWHWCNHYANFCSNSIDKEKYEIRCFRANSKYCPVRVDLSARDGMNKGKIKYNKYDWRNAKFEIK